VPLGRNFPVKRFLKTLTLLVVTLLLLASGVDATLDHLGHLPADNSLTWYDTRGNPVLAYTGEAALVQKFPRPARLSAPMVFHRG
jgi:hypothetical protein